MAHLYLFTENGRASLVATITAAILRVSHLAGGPDKDSGLIGRWNEGRQEHNHDEVVGGWVGRFDAADSDIS